MAVGLCKNKRFGGFITTGKHFRQLIPKGFDYISDLAGVDHIPVKVGSVVDHLLIELFPSHFAGQAVPFIHPLLGNQFAAVFGNLCFNQVGVKSDIYPVGHRFFMPVFADHVFIEKAECPFVRGCGQTDVEGVKIIQYLLPQVVD